MKKRIISILLVVGVIAGTWDTAVLAQDVSFNDPAETIQETEEPSLGTETPDEQQLEDVPENVKQEEISDKPEEVAESIEVDVLDSRTETIQTKKNMEAAKAEKLMPQAASYARFNTSSMYAIANYGIKKLQNKDMLLKVPGNKNGRVMPMVISPADHSTGELFGFSKVSDWYTLTPKCAGSWRLNVEGEKAETNVDVGLWTNTNHSTQGWYFEPVSGIADGYIIRSANNPECVLDIRGTNTGTGVKVKEYEPDNLHQIWIVREYAASISLNKTAATMDIGKTLALSANRRPVNAGVSYSSSNAKVATVNGSGVVTAKAAGTAVIYAKCYGKTASCKITVRKSTLSIGSKIKKTTITKGSKNGVSGTVSSNKKITKITAQIIGKSNKKNMVKPKTVKPNKTSYKLTGPIDKAMEFDKLSKGTYIFRVTAWDTSGNKVVKDIGCTVKEKAVKKGNYKKISYKITPVKQCYKFDCGIASIT